MTKISDVYEAIIDVIEGQLTTYARIPNPYALEENSALIIKKGYGLAIGPGTNTERYVGCITTWERQFTIGLVTQLVNTENDATGRALIEIDLLEAHRLLLLAFEANPGLSGTAMKAVITDDGGIDYLVGQQGKFLAIEIGLSVEYQESI